MAIINKILNLKRLDLKRKCVVLAYLIKKVLKIKLSKNERDLYIYYNYLINNNGFFKEETKDYFVSNFMNKYAKKIKLRKRPSSDFEVFNQIFGWKEYNAVVNEYKTFFLGSVDSLNIIDAGSNIGLTALFFSEHFEKGRLIAVEPDPENFKVLDYNLQSTVLFKFIKFNAALWPTNTHIKIVKDFRDKSDWSFRVEETEDQNGIKAYSINYLMESENFDFIDILKIDVEGSEKQIFTSANANLDFLNKTKCIAIEIHDEFNCREAIYSVLKSYGFTYINSGELTIGINQRLKAENQVCQ